MTENPFQPTDSISLAPPEATEGKTRLPGGIVTITVLAVGTGIVIATAINFMQNEVALFVVPLFCMTAVSTLCVFLTRGFSVSVASKVGIIFASTLASYVMFFPICIGSGLVAMMAGFEEGYFPDELGLGAASVFAATLSLNLVIGVYLMIAGRKARLKLIDEEAARLTEDN